MSSILECKNGNKKTIVSIGETYGELTITGEPFYVRTARTMRRQFCLARCSCGNVTVAEALLVRDGRIRTCGCRKGTKVRTHGGTGTRLYKTYLAMINRCYKPSMRNFERYGGRGITVCDEWRNSFTAFRDWSLANGYDETLSIDRIDNDKGYSPDNCRWTTWKVQANNRGNTAYLTAFGETKALSHWVDDPRCSVTREGLCKRIQTWSGKKTTEEIIATPVDKRKQRL